jgi:hypothetical protein
MSFDGAFVMPRLASVSKQNDTSLPSKRQAFFAPDDKEIGNNENETEAKEFLEQSNVVMPDQKEDNTNSYSKVRRLIFGSAIKYNLAKIEKKFITFSDVVEVDSNEGIELHIKQGLASRFGEGNVFRIFIFALILANSLVIGFETDVYLESRGIVFFAIIDYVFLAFFTAEICLKCFYGFVDFWRSKWNWY